MAFEVHSAQIDCKFKAKGVIMLDGKSEPHRIRKSEATVKTLLIQKK